VSGNFKAQHVKWWLERRSRSWKKLFTGKLMLSELIENRPNSIKILADCKDEVELRKK